MIKSSLDIQNCMRCASVQGFPITCFNKIGIKILFVNESPNYVQDLLRKMDVGNTGILINKMLSAINIDSNSYRITSIVLCRTAKSEKVNREPTKIEILNCMENFLAQVDFLSPEYVVFMSKLAAKFYKKQFPNSCSIVHPEILEKQGGIQSPYFLSNIQAIENLINRGV